MSHGRLLMLLVAAAFTLAACGQKGALYLPAKGTVVTRPTSPNSTPPSQPTHKDDKDESSSTPPSPEAQTPK